MGYIKKKISEWEAIEKVSESKEEELLRKLEYCSSKVMHTALCLDRLRKEFKTPELEKLYEMANNLDHEVTSYIIKLKR